MRTSMTLPLNSTVSSLLAYFRIWPLAGAGIILLSLSSGCESSVHYPAVVEVSPECRPSKSGVSFLANQVVVEHGDDAYTVLDFPEEAQSDWGSRDLLVWRAKDKSWKIEGVAGTTEVCWKANGIPQNGVWIAGPGSIASDQILTGSFIELGNRVIDRRWHVAAEKGTRLNPKSFVGANDSPTTLRFDRDYDFIAISCPDIGEVWDSRFHGGLTPMEEDLTHYSLSESLLVTDRGDRGRCNLGFGTGTTETKATLETRKYLAKHLVLDLDLDGDLSIKANDASDVSPENVNFDWRWNRAAEILKVADAPSAGARTYISLWQTKTLSNQQPVDVAQLGWLEMTTSLDFEDFSPSTKVSLLVPPGDGVLSSYVSISQEFATGEWIAGSTSLRKGWATGRAAMDRNKPYAPSMYHPPLDVVLNGRALLSGEQKEKSSDKKDFAIEIVADPASEHPPTHYELTAKVFDSEEGIIQSEFSVLSRHASFILPHMVAASYAQHVAEVTYTARVYYCEEGAEPLYAHSQDCPSGWFALTGRF